MMMMMMMTTPAMFIFILIRIILILLVEWYVFKLLKILFQSFVCDGNLYFQPDPLTTPTLISGLEDASPGKKLYRGLADFMYQGDASFLGVILCLISN